MLAEESPGDINRKNIELTVAYIKFLNRIRTEAQQLGLEKSLETDFINKIINTYSDFEKRLYEKYYQKKDVREISEIISECFHKRIHPDQRTSAEEAIGDIYGYSLKEEDEFEGKSRIELFVRSVSIFGNVSYRSSNHKEKNVRYSYKFFLSAEAAATSQVNDGIDKRLYNEFTKVNAEIEKIRSEHDNAQRAKKHAAQVIEMLAYTVPNFNGFVKFLMINDLEEKAIKILFIEHDIEVSSFFDDKTKAAITIDLARAIAKNFMSNDKELYNRCYIAFSERSR
jgi:hypothetical protein